MTEFNWNKFLQIAVPVIIGAVAASISTGWGFKRYQISRKAPFTPPRIVFPIVWTTLYIFLIVAGYLTVVEITDQNDWRLFLSIFYVQIFLNFLWCLVFFGIGDARMALVIILFLIGSVVYLIFESYKYSLTAMSFFIVYLAWLLFATFLNVGFISVNQL
jgi:benzodiazapine receptor